MIARKASRSSTRSTSAYRFRNAASQNAAIARPASATHLQDQCCGMRRVPAPPYIGPSPRITAYPTGQPFGSTQERSWNAARGRGGRLIEAMITFVPVNVGYPTNAPQYIG